MNYRIAQVTPCAPPGHKLDEFFATLRRLAANGIRVGTLHPRDISLSYAYG